MKTFDELRECINHSYRDECEDIQKFGGNTEYLDKAIHKLNLIETESMYDLPLNIGDTVYVLVYDFVAKGTKGAWSMTKTEVTDISVHHGFCVACDSFVLKGETKQIDSFRPWDDLGDRVFKTKEEAEIKIQEDKDNKGYVYEEKPITMLS